MNIFTYDRSECRRERLGRTFAAKDEFDRKIQLQANIIRNALASWTRNQARLKTQHGNQLEVALRALRSTSTHDGVASLALSDVRDRWVAHKYIKVKYVRHIPVFPCACSSLSL